MYFPALLILAKYKVLIPHKQKGNFHSARHDARTSMVGQQTDTVYEAGVRVSHVDVRISYLTMNL